MILISQKRSSGFFVLLCFDGSSSLTSKIKLDFVEDKKYPRTQQTRCQGAVRTGSSLKDKEQGANRDKPFSHCNTHPIAPK